MKKLFAFFMCLVMIISFNGCAKKTEPVNMNRLYSVEADADFNGFSANIGLNRLGNGVWDITFSKPDNLNGLAVSYENDKANVSYKGLSFSVAREDIPAEALVVALTKILDNAAIGKDISYTKKDGETTAKGKIDNIDYSLTFDKKTGCVLKLELPKMDLSVNFSDYKLMS